MEIYSHLCQSMSKLNGRKEPLRLFIFLTFPENISSTCHLLYCHHKLLNAPSKRVIRFSHIWSERNKNIRDAKLKEFLNQSSMNMQTEYNSTVQCTMQIKDYIYIREYSIITFTFQYWLIKQMHYCTVGQHCHIMIVKSQAVTVDMVNLLISIIVTPGFMQTLGRSGKTVDLKAVENMLKTSRKV